MLTPAKNKKKPSNDANADQRFQAMTCLSGFPTLKTIQQFTNKKRKKKKEIAIICFFDIFHLTFFYKNNKMFNVSHELWFKTQIS